MPTPLSRRDFARAAAAAALAGGALRTPLAAQAGAAGQATPAPDSAAAEVAAQVARIEALYGSRLTPEQRQRLPRIVAGHVDMLAAVRAVPFSNSAPPATVLRLVGGRRG